MTNKTIPPGAPAPMSGSPFMVILDEFGYYSTTGLSGIVAGACSLGFTTMVASQSIEKEAAQKEHEVLQDLIFPDKNALATEIHDEVKRV